jgi:hypothetical protein
MSLSGLASNTTKFAARPAARIPAESCSPIVWAPITVADVGHRRCSCRLRVRVARSQSVARCSDRSVCIVVSTCRDFYSALVSFVCQQWREGGRGHGLLSTGLHHFGRLTPPHWNAKDLPIGGTPITRPEIGQSQLYFSAADKATTAAPSPNHPAERVLSARKGREP